MQRLLRTAFAYMLLGVVSGLFYREYTKATDTVGIDSQLSVLHTHLLALGMLVFLVVLALDALFSLTGRRSFRSEERRVGKEGRSRRGRGKCREKGCERRG